MKKTFLHLWVFFSMAILAAWAWALSPLVVQAAPVGFQIETVVGGLNLPTDFAFAPDGRIFVAEKRGVVRIVENGVLQDEPFITLTDVNDFGDRGLISLALDPDFETNGYVYLLYTYENNPADYQGPKTGRLVRVTAEGNTARPGSEVVLLGTVGGGPAAPSCNNFATGTDCIPSDASSHSVAVVRFGPQGYLWVGLGDGARFDDVDPNALRAQDLDSLAGKVLRLNKDGSAPADNPFFDGNPYSNRSKVWNWGLRNPFRLGFHPENGLPIVADVGWYSWEELNPGYAGANFGWPCREGPEPLARYGCTPAATATDPLYAYAHDTNGSASVTGGVFADGSYYPAPYSGAYFFGDYVRNAIYTAEIHGEGGQFELHQVQTFDDNASYPVAFAVGPDGAVYYLAIYTLPSYSGEIRKIAVVPNKAPQARITADTTAGPLPLSIQFSSSQSSDEDGTIVSYQWDFGDGATSSEPNPAYTYTQEGAREVTLTVTDNEGAQGRDTITVYPGNTYPKVSITAPESGVRYRAGDTIVARANGFDAEDGALPEDAYAWRVLERHNTHLHVAAAATGSTMAFTFPTDPGEAGIFFEFEVTVRDSMGAEARASVNAYPEGFDPLFTVTAQRATPTPLYVGEPVTLSAMVQNDGNPGRGTALMVVYQTAGNNLLEERFEVELRASSTQGITAQWTPTATGTYYVDFGTFDGAGALQRWYWRALTLSVEEAPAGTTTPAAFAPAVQAVAAAPYTFPLGETATLSAEVENAGGTGTAQVLIVGYRDGGAGNLFEATSTLSFSGSGTQVAVAQWTPVATGTYYVDVGVFSEDWRTLYEWKWRGATITVTEPTTTTPTSTPPFTARLIAYSVVCESEADLPNWGVWHAAGYGDDLLDQSDVDRFLAENGDRCAPAADWEFEYGLSFPYPDSTLRGPSGRGVVFGPTDARGRAETAITFDTEGIKMWTRAVHQEGYVGFQGKTDQEDYSSEFYCNTDLWHYDNNEIITLENGGEYYCLLMTAPEGTTTPPSVREVPWYRGGLPAEVENWSWGVQTDFAAGEVRFGTSSYSLKVTPTGVWDGLYLHRAAAVPTGAGDDVFARVYSPNGGHRLALKAYDGAAREFSARSFTLSQGWNTLVLTTLPTTLSGIVLQNDSGTVEAPYYVDALLLRDRN